MCVAVINLNIISSSIQKAVEKGKRSPVIFGFIIRIILYGGGFLLAVTTAPLSGLGAAIGFVLPHLVLYFRKGILLWIKRKTGKEPKAVYVTDTSVNMFIKEPLMVSYRNNRTYLTYKHYRKKRIVQEPEKTTG